MLKPTRIDKNGFPVFDDPKTNNYKKFCHPSQHIWCRDHMREERVEFTPEDICGIGGMVEDRYTPIICRRCNKEDVEVSSVHHG